MVLVIAAVGTSGSGKTTTLEYLISNLACEGYRIGSIKHIHHRSFTIDKEGTNTWRYAKAGSKVIVAISPEEIAMIKKTDAALNDLDHVIGLLEQEQLDIIFLEGFHRLIATRKDVFKIVTAKDADDLKRTLEGTAQPILAVTGIICQQNSECGLEIPLISVLAEGEQLLKLVKECLHCKQNKAKRSLSEKNRETTVH
jgi:molybdopterin-guanine dinucleotide biosynthesis protein MobB